MEGAMNLRDFFALHIKNGRILEIGNIASTYYGVSDYNSLTPEQKLEALCQAMCIDNVSLDSIINEHSEVKRTVQGHAFEIIFEKAMSYNRISCQEIGGDGDIDLIVNGQNTQLKTPYVQGCSEGIVSYKTHKTHGAKSEKESVDYYHKVSDFADFFIGLISYVPFRVLIKPKKALPRVQGHSGYIQSPMFFDISSNEDVNNFSLLGINKKLNFPTSLFTYGNNECLPISSHHMGIKSDYILSAIFRPENFRIWDMNMRGFIREWAIKNLFTKNNVSSFPPTVTGLKRPEKCDCVLRKKTGKYTRFQIKGLTYRGCVFDGLKSRIDCETQLSRGRVNDHPTQSRLYQTSDFEYVIIAVDPPYSNYFSQEYLRRPEYNWVFYAIPVKALSTHKIFTNRIASHQHMLYSEIQKYRITEDWFAQWS